MYNIANCDRPGNAFDLVGSFFNNFYNQASPVVKEKNYAPLVDIYEKENEFFVEAQLPGMKKENVKVEIENGKLFVNGESCREEEIKEDNYYRNEIVRGKFARSFVLPENIDKDKLDANFKDGVLKIRIPKSEVTKPKQIEIN